MAGAQILQILVSGKEDLKWFDSNFSNIIETYDNKFVAVQNKRILDSDANLDNLIDKLHKKNIDTSGVLLKFVSRVKLIL